MAIMMPEADQAVLARRDQIVAALRAIVPGEGVIDSAAEMLPYESDGLMAYRQPPMVVVLPETTAQVAKVLKYCHEQGIKVVPRGSGTSLSGGALPLADGVLLGLGKFKRIREIDFDNRVVVTEPGVTNLAISQAVAHAGFYYAPDLSSQIASLRKANVDLVILGTIVRETLGAYAGARKIGWKVNMMTTIPGRNQIVTLIARKSKLSLDGLYGIGQWRIHGRTTKNKRAIAFIRTYMAKFKRPPTAESMVSYANMDWVIQGLTKAGKNLTAASFAKAMRSMTYKDPFGNPDLNLAKGNHAGPQAVAIDQVKNGGWERISPVITSIK